MEGMTVIVKTVTRILAPVMFLVGIYVTLHGHLTPGGGFQGGVMLAGTFVMLLLAFGVASLEKKVSFRVGETVKGIGAAMIAFTAVVGLIFGFWFFKNIGVYWYGIPGEVFSAGSLPLYNIWEAAHVALAFLVAFYCFTKKESGDKK